MMLGRLAIVIYSVGLLFGAILLLNAIIQLGETFNTARGFRVNEAVVLSLIGGSFCYGVGWAIRYVVSGAKGISPMAPGKDEAGVDEIDGDIP
jgi:hypothetical protein